MLPLLDNPLLQPVPKGTDCKAVRAGVLTVGEGRIPQVSNLTVVTVTNRIQYKELLEAL